jgi:hypothetical protein
MSAAVIDRLKKLAGAATTTDAPAAPATKVAAAPTMAAKANPKWLQDLDEPESEDEEATTEEPGSIDDDDVEESDLPDATHREPQPAAEATMSDEFASKVADLVVARIRDALNHLVLD